MSDVSCEWSWLSHISFPFLVIRNLPHYLDFFVYCLCRVVLLYKKVDTNPGKKKIPQSGSLTKIIGGNFLLTNNHSGDF
jgi:hypothetical protein